MNGFDVFRVDDEGRALWVGAFPSVTSLSERVHFGKHDRYLIRNATTGDKIEVRGGRSRILTNEGIL
jgi:hypothetical protein